MGVSTGAPLPPAENFKPRPHGAELAKAELKADVIARLDVEMQRHVAAKNVASISAILHKDGVRVLKPKTVDLIFENHLKHPKMKYGLGGIVNGAGSYGWGGADGTQFVLDRSVGPKARA
jgi:hypothetical protein